MSWMGFDPPAIVQGVPPEVAACRKVQHKVKPMRFRGGHNIRLQGRPDGAVKVLPEPKVLYLPLQSKRFLFNELRVVDGQHVDAGDVLARDLVYLSSGHRTTVQRENSATTRPETDGMWDQRGSVPVL